MRFSMAYDDRDFRAVVKDFITGKFEGVGKMITSRISIEDLVVGGLEELVHKKDHHVKIVATPKKALLEEAARKASSRRKVLL